MAIPYAEVIGDPIEHSKSPLIHGFWLKKLGIEGDYRRTKVDAAGLPAYLEAKRRDFWWRGCNVTAPLKEKAAGLVGTPPILCRFIGAVNCITRTPLSCLVGTNSDIAGIEEALSGFEIKGVDAVIIGAGGAARAALCHLISHEAGRVTILGRDGSRAASLGAVVPGDSPTRIVVEAFDAISAATQGARLFINATPMGMRGGPPMHVAIIDLVRNAGGQALVFDMVYDPAETEFLAAGREAGARIEDGLKMLIGQAAPAFELFFGAAAPRQHDPELRALLDA